MLKSLIAICLAATAASAHAQVQRYERKTMRRNFLRIANQTRTSSVRVVGKFKSRQAKAFVDYYVQVISPRFEKYSKDIAIYRAISALRDSNSSLNPSEEYNWKRRFRRVMGRLNAFAVSEEVTNELNTWAQLAEGLSGDLPDMARQYKRERELESIPAALKPQLDEMERLDDEYMKTLNVVPATDNLEIYSTEMLNTVVGFKTGKLSFQEAHNRAVDLTERYGHQHIGYQAVQRKGENLNRIALLRTQIAQAKGFQTWAQYVLASSGDGYDLPFRGTTQQIEFLRTYLAAMKPALRQLVQQWATARGLQNENLTSNDIRFISPNGTEMIKEYFPQSKVTDVWESVLLENGFTPEFLRQIYVDDQLRPGKNRTSAYLSSVYVPDNRTEIIQAETLSSKAISKAPSQLRTGFNFILQSYKAPGLSGLSTAFHEGGHSTDYLLRFKNRPNPQSYGYTEVASITSEHFTEDAELLYNYATPIDGKKPSVAEFRQAIENQKGKELNSRAYLAKMSLFDLLLWDYDYQAQGAQTFLERVASLTEELDREYDALPSVPTTVPEFYGYLETGHFISGSVRNIGYDFAYIASDMMAEYLSDELEAVSGRRNWYQQPEFARIYADKFVSQGWKGTFPSNIEAITGRKFDAMASVDAFCAKYLR
jgi:hypothetical protein